MAKHAIETVAAEDVLRTIRALADPGRVRILLALRSGELCVCQLTELLELSPSTVSRHLSGLRQAGLADLRKDGRWVFYRRPGPGAEPHVTEALQWLDRHLGGTAEAREDGRRLRDILSIPPEELCRRSTS